jgi:hypothetical protein
MPKIASIRTDFANNITVVIVAIAAEPSDVI